AICAADLAHGIRPYRPVGRRRLAGGAYRVDGVLDPDHAAGDPRAAAAALAMACDSKRSPSFGHEGGAVAVRVSGASDSVRYACASRAYPAARTVRITSALVSP